MDSRHVFQTERLCMDRVYPVAERVEINKEKLLKRFAGEITTFDPVISDFKNK